MDFIQLIGGIKAEIKTETEDNVVEIGIEDIGIDDDAYNEGDELLDKNKQLSKLGNVEIKLSKKNVPKLDSGTEKSKGKMLTRNGCKESEDGVKRNEKQKDNDKLKNTIGSIVDGGLPTEEKLVLNYTGSENLQNVDSEVDGNIDWTGAYRTYEGTPTHEDQLKVKVNKVPTSHVSPTEYTKVVFDKYRCNHCRLITSNKKAVSKHIRKIHRALTTTYECPYCQILFKSRRDLSYHIIHIHKTASELVWFRCDKCKYQCKTKALIAAHVLTHMDPLQMMDLMNKCNQCPKMFKKTSALARHIQGVHNSDSTKRFKCFQCPFDSKTKAGIKKHIQERHMTAVEDMETLKCPKCIYTTKFKSTLQLHVSSRHRLEFQCHICKYRSYSKLCLDLHIIGHKKEKDEEDLKYRCDRCDYKTYRFYSLKVHKLKHLKPEEIQYFYCYHCEFKAKRKDNLKTHVLRHYKRDQVPLHCYMCDFTTPKRDVLMRHIDKHAEELEEVRKPDIETKRKKKRVKEAK